ncbi:hypothetical protein F4553_002402 [Allocatelliglobosispora scoriae]|uniref:PknH-like extracellular domain-containing protein n=1 Tax=Allocatelliglobosispora scoriae TaxID=643052 RepID=A0A841BQ03_9ACTN|nr:hypothetical protein [Allocatelliglobosispora scoriae]MBB5869023.1 hypothetical protein [Allocatelliglobosispora scoriae]
MRSNLIGRGAALALAVGLIATAAACSSSQPAASPKQDVQAVTVAQSVDLRSALVPLSAQPDTRSSAGPLTLKQAAESGAMTSPKGVVFTPANCGDYLARALGNMGDLNGYIQYGSRDHDTHKDNFIQAAVEIPGGVTQAVIDKVREALKPCATGTVTLDGKVTGQVSYVERPTPALAGTVGYSITGMTRFAVKPGTPEAKIVENYELPPGAQLNVDSSEACVEQVNITGTGTTLFVVQESDVALANSITTQMYNNLKGVKTIN